MTENNPLNPPAEPSVDPAVISTRDKITLRVIEEEMKNAYVTYAMSVIVGRALPDVRDGLKPVHRRILYAMYDLGMTHNKPFKKCARIVGETLGKYHPHGDTAVYDSMVRMGQDFSLRYPLIKGQGNWGSIDGDNAAAMRYCVTGDTLVQTEQGLIPIKDISPQSEEKINITVLDCRGKPKKAIKFFNSGKHKVVKITTQQGYSLKGSYNHPILCWSLNEFGFPSLNWKLLGDVTLDDHVVINRKSSLFSSNDPQLKKYFPIHRPREKEMIFPKEMNKKLAFLLGALVSEGSFHQNKIIFNNQDRDFYQAVKNSILSNFPKTTLYERDIAGNCRELEIYHQKIVRFLDNLGLKPAKAHQKEIPHIVFQSKKETVREFLRALFEGDGSVQLVSHQKHGGKALQLTYDSKSKKLLEQLKILLLNFGIITSDPVCDKRSACYRLNVLGVHNIDLFRKEIGFFSSRKNNILFSVKYLNSSRMSRTDYIPFLAAYLRKNYSSTFITKNNFDRYNTLKKNASKLAQTLNLSDQKMIAWLLEQNYFFNKIKKIERLPAEDVYSLKVDSLCHSFVANGFINHNTEAKLQKLAEEMLKDIEKDTVDFSPNFDDSLTEPTVLPSILPNLLINGSSGIAVGMATNIPPHNIKEICHALISTIDNPDITVEELMRIVPAPDFPTGGEILCGNSLRYAYSKGRGKIIIKSITYFEDKKIIIKEIPYQVNKTELIEQIAELVKDKRVEGIRNINDESDQEGIRVVIDLKNDADPDFVLNQLYQYSNLKVSFGLNLLALVNNQPKTLGLKDFLHYHITHRQDVITRRTKFDLKEAQEKVHVLDGLLVALNNLDTIIPGIKNSKTVEDAKIFLMGTYQLTEIQAKAILELRLQKLASLEQEKIRLEHQDYTQKIIFYLDLLASPQKILEIIKDESRWLIEQYGDERKSKITIGEDEENIEMEDLIEEENVVVTMTRSGYVKRLPLDTYKTQKRGGKGVIAAGTKEEDFVERLYVASTHDHLLFFTNHGQVYWLKVYHIPETSRQATGKHLANLLEMAEGEQITAIVPVRNFQQGYLFMSTKNGTVKKTSLMEFSNPRKGGIRAINLDANDTLVGVKYTAGDQEIILATRLGQANRFNEKDVRSMGRTAGGVRGIRLDDGDEVIGMLAAEEGMNLLTLTEKGYGKRTPIEDYRLCNRGGKGVTNIKITDKNGPVKTVMLVNGKEELMLISKQGVGIRMKCSDISIIGRATQGVRVMRLEENDQLAAAAKIIVEGENGTTISLPPLPPSLDLANVDNLKTNNIDSDELQSEETPDPENENSNEPEDSNPPDDSNSLNDSELPDNSEPSDNSPLSDNSDSKDNNSPQ